MKGHIGYDSGLISVYRIVKYIRYMTTTKHRRTTHRATSKRRPISGEILQEDQHGWKVICIYGNAYDRGYAHGHLLQSELRNIVSKLRFLITVVLDMPYDAYMTYCRKHILPIVQYEYTEIYDELRGIRDGARHAITMLELIAWNAWLSMYNVKLFVKKRQTQKKNQNRRKHLRKRRQRVAAQRCSAFIATGDATKAGSGIVMAHNTHADMASAVMFNIVIYVDPATGTGHPFVMQTCAGYVASGSDWFITQAGIVGCETTISDTNYDVTFRRRDRHPYFCRIRRVMQYGTTLDECAEWMQLHNAGDYPCSWLFGDIRTGEIMLYENGWTQHNVQRTTNGVFYGMNSAHDFALRNRETDDLQYVDPTTSSGARNVRLDALLNHRYYGKIDIDVAKRVLADHYDIQVERDRHPSSRTICNHYFLDPTTSSPYYPHSNTDGKVVDSRMAKQMSFCGRWGASCGMAFSAKDHLRSHPEYKSWQPYLVDLPSQPWTNISYSMKT